jgi:hypothetical protein
MNLMRKIITAKFVISSMVTKNNKKEMKKKKLENPRSHPLCIKG